MRQILFGRIRPATAKQRRIFLWVDFGRYLLCAAVSAGILGLAAADPDSVPRAVVPVLVAAAVAVLCSALAVGAILLALRDREPRAVLRTAFVIWCAGIVGTVLAAIAVAASSEAPPGVFVAFLALPFLVFTKPPARAGLQPV